MHGQSGTHPTVNVDYASWGSVGNLQAMVVDVVEAQPYKQQLSSIVDLNGFELAHAAKVDYYRGEHAAMPAIWLRFERVNNKGLGGEHISAVFDTEQNRLLGFARMLADLGDQKFVSHQQALNKAISFLQQQAPDLITNANNIPQLNNLPDGSRMEFPAPHIDFEQVQFRWIDQHPEALFAMNKTIVGMKVKMYLPVTGLWTWVIVDHQGEVMVFERDVSWNFEIMQRNTQMWLDDAWLQAQGINI